MIPITLHIFMNISLKIVPKFIILILIPFAYNSINKEKNTGSLKLVITQSISRWSITQAKG